MTSLLPAEIATSRLRMRPPALADAEVIFDAYAQDPAVCRFMVWTPHPNVATTHEFLRHCADAWEAGVRRAYVITTLASDNAIGMLEARLQATTVDIGYVLAQSHWGQGYMPEAIQAFAAAALAAPGLFRVQASCDIDNIASQRALEKAGWRREGRLERLTVHPNLSHEPRACFLYAKVR